MVVGKSNVISCFLVDHMFWSSGLRVRFSISQGKGIGRSSDSFDSDSFVAESDEVVESKSVDFLNEPLVPFLTQVLHSHTFSS